MKREQAKNSQDASEYRMLLRIQFTFLPAALAAHLIRIAAAWFLLSQESQVFFAVFVATTTTAQVASRLLLGGLGDFFHAMKLVTAWTLVCAVGTVLLTATLLSSPAETTTILALGCLIAIGQGARDPTVAAVLPKLGSARQVSALVPVRSAMNASAQIAGPVLATIILALTGPRHALVVACCLYTAGAVATAFHIGHFTALSSADFDKPPSQPRTYLQIISHPMRGLVRYMAVRSECAMACICFIINAVLPAFFLIVIPTLINAQGSSVMLLGAMDASFGLGVCLGSFFVANTVASWVGRSRCMIIGVGVCGLSLVIATVTSAPIAITALFMGGVGLSLLNTNTMTVRALATPKRFISGMCATAAFISALAIPAGNWAVSAAVLHFGHTSVGMGIGVIIVLCATAISRISTWREMSHLSPEQLQNHYLRRYPHAFQ